ncbi:MULTISPECIES: hypothetical protein [Sphingobium]|uniref:Uncharacterized protein n=1 Tax=Sphingobium fuliginis (strain ATCC 27551) TaxID=336203 RepID=A0ABQ1EWU6_SPHSA|nr:MULTISPECIES: hypothetical protein [Sphingobium]RYL98680.1 hypothetical protein EWH10_09215 [Sphingobium fuliginis]WDA37487.1 hypothetical protein PO876_04625 [Sphingobium sp. YC-XJ3]GFZ89567.1 hypothetical protein GCM10019071_19390 [Sphingobium fuliginis]
MMEHFEANAALGMEAVQLTAAAARGDIDAQRKLRDYALESMAEKVAANALAYAHGHAVEAMIWARLAASHGEEEDAIQLTAALAYLSEFWGMDGEGQEYGNFLLGEVVTILDGLASRGNEDAAISLNAVSEMLNPRISNMAKKIKETVDAGF